MAGVEGIATSNTTNNTGASAPAAALQIAQRLDTSLVDRGQVLLIGLGGIGLPLARAVATFLAGLCYVLDSLTVRLVLCDGDAYHDENAYRMDLPGSGQQGRGPRRRVAGPLPLSELPGAVGLGIRHAGRTWPG